MRIDFYIAGIQKSGTTNLAYLLSRSSNIITHPQMECTYYWDEKEYTKGKKYLRKNYFFDFKGKDFETHYTLLKHSNSFTNPEVLKRVVSENPQVQILLVFRNPVQRYISSFLMEKTRSLYPLTLSQSIEKALSDKNSFEHQVFLKYGEYDYWIEKILNIIPENNLHFFLFEELYDDKEFHLKNFTQKYQLDFNPYALKNVSIINTYKEPQNSLYQKILVNLRHSNIKNIIKQLIPIKYWVQLSQKIEHINLIEPPQKPLIEKELENILSDYYSNSIVRFEQLTGLKTNWLFNQKMSKNA